MSTAELQEYAWKWFEYHAGQRLTAFRFFLVFLGVLIVGFNAGLKDGHIVFAQVVACFGAFISIAFLMLEIRNEQLVNVGRNALMCLEESDESLKAQKKLQMLHVDRGRSRWLSHKYWFRAIYIVCAVLFIIGAIRPSIVYVAPLQ
jgi:Mn2+/Fe2+ NRAMP family transporter